MIFMNSRQRRSKFLGSALIVSFLCSVALQPLFAAEFISKKYQFKEDVWLELNASVKNVILKSIKFKIPAKAEGKFFVISGAIKADVLVENKSEHDQKVGIAIALFDSEGNLVGVGSSGSKMFFKVKPGKKNEYAVTFSYVTEMIDEASTFQITLELR